MPFTITPPPSSCWIHPCIKSVTFNQQIAGVLYCLSLIINQLFLSDYKITKFRRLKRNFQQLSENAPISIKTTQKNNCSDKFMKLMIISKLAIITPLKTALWVIFFQIICNRLTFSILQSQRRRFIWKSRFSAKLRNFYKTYEIPVFFLILQPPRALLPYTHNK